MGLFDWFSGKKYGKCSGCGCSIHKDSSLCINCQILKEAEKKKPEVKKASKKKKTVKSPPQGWREGLKLLNKLGHEVNEDTVDFQLFGDDFERIGEEYLDSEKNSHTYTDGSIAEGKTFESFIKDKKIHLGLIKFYAWGKEKLNEGTKIDGKIWFDWEALKVFYLNLDEEEITHGPTLQIILEVTLDCLWDFGKLDIDLAIDLARYRKNEISEEELDEQFEYFIILKNN